MNMAIDKLGWILVHSVWQFTLAALVAACAMSVLRRHSASWRYAVLSALLGGLVAAPLATWFWLPEISIADNRAQDLAFIRDLGAELDRDRGADSMLPAGSEQGPLLEAEQAATDVPVEAVLSDHAAVTEPKPRLAAEKPELSWNERFSVWIDPWMNWIVACWSLGVLLCSLRPLLGWYTLTRLKRHGISPVGTEIEALFRRLAKQIGLKRAVRLWQSSLTQVPLVVGYLKPVVLVPIGIVANLPLSQVEAILAHELVHIRRHDFLVNLVQTLLETLFFYHPAVWWLSHRLRIERENCCDDLVLQVLENRVEYGKALVAVEELRGRSTVLALGMSDGSLLSRVRRIVGATPDQAANLWRDRWPLFGLAIASLLFAASALWWDLKTMAANADEIAAVSREETDADSKPGAIQVELKLPRQEYFLGESIALDYEMTNASDDDQPYGKGGYYPDLRINDGYRMTAEPIDRQGKVIGKPVATWPMPENFGGPVGNFQLAPGDSYATTLFVTRYLRFLEPGRYRLRVENIDRLNAANSARYAVGETIITLKQPTSAEARGVFQTMKQAPREAYDKNAMTFLAEAADFQAMHQPVYLPILRDAALEKDLDAFSSLEKMESSNATQVLVQVIEQSLQQDDWRTARLAFQNLKNFLPFPNWYADPKSSYGASERERVERTWKAEFRPPLIALARRLNLEVADIMGKVWAKRRKPAEQAIDLTEEDLVPYAVSGRFPAEHPQSLLIDSDYIYRCLGQPDVMADCLNALHYAIELANELPLETHQYFRPRGSAYGIRMTMHWLFERGAKAPEKPIHPGELAAFAYQVGRDPKFRPEGWEATIMEALKQHVLNPYLAEIVLDSLPKTPPQSVLDYLPTLLADKYIDLQIAACHVAEKNPRAEYRQPLQVILERATDEYLRKYAVDAARTNGIDAEYDAGAPFVDEEAEARRRQPQQQQPKEPAKEQPKLDEQKLTDAKLDFLKSYPALKDVSLETTEKEFRELLRSVKLPFHRKLEGAQFRYQIELGGGFLLIAAFDQNEQKCTGLQRIRGELPRPAKTFADHLNVMGAVFDAKSQAILSVATETDVKLRRWNIAENKLANEAKLASDLHGNRFVFGQLRLSANGERLIAVADQQIGVWNTETGALVHNLKIPENLARSMIRDLAVTPNAQFVAVGLAQGFGGLLTGDAYAVVWNAETGEVLQSVTHAASIQVQSVAISDDGKRLATGGQQRGTCVWDVETGDLLLDLPNDNEGRQHPIDEISISSASQVLCLKFSPDGKKLALGDMLGVKILNAVDGKLLHDLEAPFRMGRSGLVFSRDGKLVARIATDESVPIWEVATGKLLTEIPTEAHGGDFSPDGQWFATAFTDEKQGLALWRLRGEKEGARRAVDNAEEIEVAEAGEIRGELLDLAGNPIAGATIACGAVINDSGKGGGANCVTDALGKYRLPVPSPGIYNVWLKKSPAKELIAAADDGLLVEAGKVAESRLTLMRGTEIHGVVLDEDEKPMAGIEVYCHSLGHPISGGPESTKSGEDGKFAFTLCPGDAHFYAQEKGVGPFGKADGGAVHRGEKVLTIPPIDQIAPVTAFNLQLVPSQPKFGDPAWTLRSTRGTRVLASAKKADVTGTVVDERGVPLTTAKVFKFDGPILPVRNGGEFQVPVDRGSQFIMFAYAPGYHVWFGTPTSGDTLLIAMEKKSLPAAPSGNEQGGRAVPQTAPEFIALLRSQVAKVTQGRLELAYDYEWRRPTKEDPDRAVKSHGTLRRLKKENLLRVEFERQIANPAPQEHDLWTEHWVTGFDGELAYTFHPRSNQVKYGLLHSGIDVENAGDFWAVESMARFFEFHPQAKFQLDKENHDGRPVWTVRLIDDATKKNFRYVAIDPQRGFLPQRIEVQWLDHTITEFDDMFEAAPGLWIPKRTTSRTITTGQRMKRAGYIADRIETTVVRLEPEAATKLRPYDFQFVPPQGVTVRQWVANGQLALPPTIRHFQIQFLGGEPQSSQPIGGLKFEVVHGWGGDRKSLGEFTTDKSGIVDLLLPAAYYHLDLKPDRELPYLAVEKSWNGLERRTLPVLGLNVTKQGPAKTIAESARDKTAEPLSGTEEVPRLTYTLLPACELTLRAVDAETGQGLAGAEFYQENAVGEMWADKISAENLGARFTTATKNVDSEQEWLTDRDGNFRRLVSANAGYLYGVTRSPSGYEPAESGREVEIPIVYGQRTAKHTFKFRKIKAATNPEQAPQADTEKQDPKVGALKGRFVYDGEPFEPPDLDPGLTRLEADSPLPRDSDGRVYGVSILYQAYLRQNIRPKTTDQSLLVGKNGGVANLVVWAESPNIPWKRAPDANTSSGATIRLRGGNFEPRITLLTVDQPLTIANHDPVELGIHAYFRRNAEILGRLPVNSVEKPMTWTLEKSEKMPVWYRCDQAPWAQGWILVHDNPYMAVTDAEGRFTIPNLPPGEWEFRAWHERQGYIPHWPKGLFKQKISVGVADLGTIKLSPAMLASKNQPTAQTGAAPTAPELPANPWDRLVSLRANNMPLQEALVSLATQAQLTLSADDVVLKAAGLDLTQRVTLTIDKLPLEKALGRLIDWSALVLHGVLRDIQGTKLVITTLETQQRETARRLPEWLRPHYGNGLVASVNQQGEVTLVSVGRLADDAMLERLSTLPALGELAIETTENLTKDGLKQLAKMKSLEKLSLFAIRHNGEGLGDAAIRNLIGLDALRELSISECGTTDDGMTLLEQLPHLSSLTIRQEGRLTDVALRSIGKLTRLRNLSLPNYVATQNDGRMQFSAEGTRELRELRDLESLQLMGHEIAPESLDFPRLRSLSLGHRKIGDDVAQQIARHRKLQNLELGYCNITDGGLGAIATLEFLENLSLSSETITDIGLAHLSTHPRLKHLQLRLRKFTDDTLQSVAQLKTLTRIDLNSVGRPPLEPNQALSGTGLRELAKLPNLDTLYISGFQFPGVDGLVELKQLRTLTLDMVSIAEHDLELLEDRLPDTTIHYSTGGGFRLPRRARQQFGQQQPK